mmetsp:Transcript_99500/g.249448  ORF Transcript_99500/g.249448 Transcript_99500/m.249448 type:complete len:465 (-) Transcript_99500:2313-3707(-)
MVLIVPLAIPKDGIAWKLNAEQGLLPAIRLSRACVVDQAAVISAILTWMNSIAVSMCTFVLAVDEGDLEATRELFEHAIGVLELCLVEELVHLHGDHASEAIAGIPDSVLREGAAEICLRLEVTLQGRVVVAHACDRAPQGLQAHRSPRRQLLPLGLCVLVPLVRRDWPIRDPGPHAVREGHELLLVFLLQPMHERHDAAVVFSKQLLLLDEDLLSVVRDEHSDAWEERCPVRSRHGKCQSAAQGRKPPPHVRVARLMAVRHAAIRLEGGLRGILPTEQGWHLHPQSCAHATCNNSTSGRWPVRSSDGFEWLLQVLPQNTVPCAFGVEGQVGHSVTVDIVLIPHISNDPVPNEWEGGGELGLPLAGLLRWLGGIAQDALREALGDLRHCMLKHQIVSFPCTLLEHGEHSQASASDGEPELGVGREQRERGGPQSKPQQDVGPPIRGEIHLEDLSVCLVTNARNV